MASRQPFQGDSKEESVRDATKFEFGGKEDFAQERRIEPISSQVINQSYKEKIGTDAKITQLPASAPISLIFAILPVQFPFTIFTLEFVTRMKSYIEGLISSTAHGNVRPRLIYIIYQAGYCKVSVADIFTKNWIVDKFSNWTYNSNPLIVRPLSRIPRCIYGTSMPIEIFNNLQIFPLINHQNQTINTKLWRILAEGRNDGEIFILIEVDAENAHAIESLSNVISFNHLPIQFGLLYITNRYQPH